MHNRVWGSISRTQKSKCQQFYSCRNYFILKQICALDCQRSLLTARQFISTSCVIRNYSLLLCKAMAIEFNNFLVLWVIYDTHLLFNCLCLLRGQLSDQIKILEVLYFATLTAMSVDADLWLCRCFGTLSSTKDAAQFVVWHRTHI